MSEQNKIRLYGDAVLSGVRKLSARVESSNSPGSEGDIDVHYVIRVLLKHYRTVAITAIVFMLLALIASLLMKPVYRSQATIEIQEQTPDIETLQQLQSRNPDPNNAVLTEIETQIGVLKSEGLARQVIDQVILPEVKKPGFSVTSILGNGWKAFTQWWTRSDAGSSVDARNSVVPTDSLKANPATMETAFPISQMDIKAYERLINSFESSLTVTRVGSSRLVTVSYESGDPYLSARVVNTLVSDYLQLHEKSTEKLTKLLAKQVQEARDELESSEQKMTEYARRNGLLYLETDNGASQDIVSARLRQIQDELTKAQADRYQQESIYNLVQKGDYGSLPGVFQDKLLQDLTKKVADLKSQYAQISTTFTDNYPQAKQIKNQLAVAEEMLARERQRAAENITNNYLASVRREALLLRAYNEQKNAANKVAEKSTQYNMLKLNANSDNQLYDSLLQKVKEASLVARIKANNVNVVDKAVPQFFPVKPKILLNLALGFVVGLGLGIGIAFLRDHLDTSLKTADEVDRFLGVPALAMIPSVDSLPQLVSNGNNHNGNGLTLPDVFNPSDLSKREQPWYRIDKQIHREYSPLVEAFRTLGSSVMLEASGQKRTLRSLVITSSQPGEGKTTVCVNLAIALAEQGKRVILIDADLRRPSVHRALGFRNIRGLSGYLGGLSEWAPCVLPGLTPGLDTLPAGKPPRNPVALLSSLKMKTLLAQALEEYEYVIVDSPALMPSLADARILASLVDGSILVVRSGMAPREYVIRARRHLNNVFGVVLNSMDVRSPDYYYYGYGAYGYGPRNDDQEPGDGSYGEKIAGL